jgi:hypothetical protein
MNHKPKHDHDLFTLTPQGRSFALWLIRWLVVVVVIALLVMCAAGIAIGGRIQLH